MNEKSARQAPEFFLDTWNVYHKLVAENYMFHRELYAEVLRLLSVRATKSPLSFLDLGCGDGASIAPLLEKTAIASYLGVDLSGVALELARENLSSLACPIEFRLADMLGFLQEDSGSYDLIFSSYALHHLVPDDKRAFLKACRQRLAPGGELMLIDIAREENQGLPAFLDRFCDEIAREWNALEAEERDYATAHVRDNDLAERVSDLRMMAMEGGFSRFEIACRHDIYYLFRIRSESD